MTNGGRPKRPTKILLATDLSSRCDRAQDRAFQLAHEWNSDLHVVHVIPQEAEPGFAGDMWTRPWQELDELREQAERQLARHAEATCGETKIRLHVEQGRVDQVICDVAKREGCGLIVTGVARNETFGRMLLGDTVDLLVRKSPIPVLVVRNRVLGVYPEVLATTDYSAGSADALRAALVLFPQSRTSLFHADDIPFSGLLNVNDAIRAEFREVAERAAREFLKSENFPDGLPRMLVQGSAAAEVAKYLEDHDALVVVGRRGASAAVRALLGSTASRILDLTFADVLVVPSMNRESV